MIDHPATLMFAGAAIGATVTCLWWAPRFRALARQFDELTGRAAASGSRITEQSATIQRLTDAAAERWKVSQKLQRAQETLNTASAQNTMAAARKVIAEGLERVRCAGERDEIDGGAK